MTILGPFGGNTSAAEIAEQVANRLSGNTQVVVTSPVVAGGDVQIVQGDAYESRDGRALTWRSDAWPDLRGASVTLTATSKYDGRQYLNVPCTASVGSVTCELSSTQTAAIPVGGYRINITASYPDGHAMTLVQAEMTVTPRAGGAA